MHWESFSKIPKMGLSVGRRNSVLKINKISSHKLGKAGEKTALQFLKKKNFRIVEQGFRFYKGEIDIIAYDMKTLVFLEVKTRRSHKFGFPEDALTPSKQNQLRKIALGYCTLHKIQDVECRFDVLSLNYTENGYSISHIENAF